MSAAVTAGSSAVKDLAFASLHFGEGAAHHCSAAEQLNAEMAHARVPTRGLTCERKSQRLFRRESKLVDNNRPRNSSAVSRNRSSGRSISRFS